MIKYDELYIKTKERLSEKRFLHTEGVVKRALEYAKIYGVDEEKVKLSALAHDIAKELSDQEKEEYIKKYNIDFDDIEKKNNGLQHAKIGAYICKNEYGFTDDMVQAVKYHTTGRENMSMIEKIIYLADSTEENRKHGKYYADLIKQDIDAGMYEVIKYTINKIIESNKILHLNSIKCYNYYNMIVSKK